MNYQNILQLNWKTGIEDLPPWFLFIICGPDKMK